MTVTELFMYPAALMRISGCEINLLLSPRREMGRPISRTSRCPSVVRAYLPLRGFVCDKALPATDLDFLL